MTAAYGINGFTEEMLEAFLGHGIERVLIAYDRDDAGETAAAKLAEQLIAAGIDCYRVQFPRGMDANEYALKVTPAAKSLALVIRKAAWMGQGEAPAVELGAALRRRRRPPRRQAATTAAKEETSPAPPLAAEPPAAESAPAEPPTPPAEASPLPAPPPPAPPAVVKEQEVVISLGDRRYRVRGLAKNLAYDVLKINLLASRREAFHVDTLDLYSARHRAVFQKAAAGELGVDEEVIKTDLGKVLLEARGAAGRADPRGAGAQERGRRADRRRAGRGARAAALARAARRASSRTSSAAAWWARRPTSSWATWRRRRACSSDRWRW